MDYVAKLSEILEETKRGVRTPLDCGIEASHIISDENLSYGELNTIESELNKLGASLYEADEDEEVTA